MQWPGVGIREDSDFVRPPYLPSLLLVIVAEFVVFRIPLEVSASNTAMGK